MSWGCFPDLRRLLAVHRRRFPKLPHESNGGNHKVTVSMKVRAQWGPSWAVFISQLSDFEKSYCSTCKDPRNFRFNSRFAQDWTVEWNSSPWKHTPCRYRPDPNNRPRPSIYCLHVRLVRKIKGYTPYMTMVIPGLGGQSTSLQLVDSASSPKQFPGPTLNCAGV